MIPTPPIEPGSAVAVARRRLMIWAAVVVVGLVVIIAGMALMSDDYDADDPAPGGVRLSVAACNRLQDDFDNQSAINALAQPGSPTFDRSLDRMDSIDAELRSGGCYDG